MSNESMAETYERSEMGTPTELSYAEVVTARRKLIRDEAECEYCGTTLTICKAERGKDPTAPPWFGCCAHGLDMEPCSHRSSGAAKDALLDEIAAGHVRTVEEVLAARRPTMRGDYLTQGTWWRNRAGEFIPIAEMSPGHRYNSAAMLLRNNPDDRYALRFSTLYHALTKGLTIQGEGVEPWQKTGCDPVTGEPCEVPPRLTQVCEIPDCGCSGEAHA